MTGRRGGFAGVLAVFVVFSAIYCATVGSRLMRPSPNNHYVHLTDAWLHGRLDLGGLAPGNNDWACFDTERQAPCPGNARKLAGNDRFKWFVSFPPFPAVLLTPLVAVFGTDLPDRFVWALFAGLAPALLFFVLGTLRRRGLSTCSTREDLVLTTLFGVGSVFFFVAVQGTVWFSAHVVASILICLYLYGAIETKHPMLAGVALGLLFLTRPTALLLGVLFLLQTLELSRRDRSDAIKRLVHFGVPVAVLLCIAAWHNYARFGDPTEFGHRFLQVRWRGRIETWGLFSFHYLPRNLAIFLASMPWWLGTSPFIRISGHGLALWFTTPNLLWSLFPKRPTRLTAHLWLAIIPVALADLLYQNSGWVQFGYRFALDYLPLVFVLIAVGDRRFGKLFYLAAVFSIAVNTFGAFTFDRAPQFYHVDADHSVIFQPD